MTITPNPTRGPCSVSFAAGGAQGGNLLVFDAQGRTRRLLRPVAGANGRMRAEWDGCDADGLRVGPGIYFVRWRQGGRMVGARVSVIK